MGGDLFIEGVAAEVDAVEALGALEVADEFREVLGWERDRGHVQVHETLVFLHEAAELGEVLVQDVVPTVLHLDPAEIEAFQAGVVL
jgi:hypothetical protein